MASKATYACLSCGFEKAIAENPHYDGPLTVRTGCPRCERITQFMARSTPQYAAHLDHQRRRGRT